MGELSVDCATQTGEFEFDLDPNVYNNNIDGWGSSPRVQIDTSAPFASVAEAVIRFGGHGFWIPRGVLCSAAEDDAALNPDDGDCYDSTKLEQEEDNNIPTKIFKNPSLKQQEALDVFMNDLKLTKDLIEELELKLHNSSSAAAAACSENSSKEHPNGGAGEEQAVKSEELKQAKINLSQSTSELASIRAAVELLNRKLEQEEGKSASNKQQQEPEPSSNDEKTRKRTDKDNNTTERPTLVSDHHRHLSLDTTASSSSSSSSSSSGISKQQQQTTNPVGISRELQELNHEADQFMRTAEAAKSEVSRALRDIERTKTGLIMIEMRWAAAKKMEEAAQAAEKLALAEIRALSSSSSGGGQPQEGDTRMTVSLSLEEYNSLAEKARRAENAAVRFADVSEVVVDRRGSRGKEAAMRKMALEQFMGRVEVADRRRLMMMGTEHPAAKRRDNNNGRRPPNPPRTEQMMRDLDCRDSYELSSSFLSRNLSLGSVRHLEDDDEVEEEDSGSRRDRTKPSSIGDVLRRKKRVVWRDELDLGRGGVSDQSSRDRVSLNQMLRSHREENATTTSSSSGRSGMENSSHGDHHHHSGYDKFLFWKRIKGFGFIHVTLPLSGRGRNRVHV